MADFLTLCQEFRIKAGIAGTGPAAVTGQSGEYLRLITWIKNAWLNLQNEQYDWKWMWRDDGSITVLTNTDTYSLTGVKKIHRQTFTIYQTSLGVSDRSKLKYMGWAEFKRKFVDTVATGTDRPSFFTQKPNGDIMFYPKPNADFTVEHEYQKSPQILAGNTDTPELPVEYHEIIQFKALIDHGGFEETSDVYRFASEQYAYMFDMLLWNEKLQLEEYETVIPE